MTSRTSMVKAKSRQVASEDTYPSTYCPHLNNDAAEFVHSNPVPLEEDSDSDFNPGSYIHEPERKGRSLSKSSATKGPPGRRKRRETLADIADYQPKKVKGTKASAPQPDNLLVECFKDLGLQPVSEDEGIVDDNGDLPADLTLSTDGGDEEPEPPVMLRTFKVLQRLPVSDSNASSAARDGAHSIRSSDDSETESDATQEHTTRTSPPLKRKELPSATIAPFMKKRKLESDDDSVTESETEEEVAAQERDSGSETESDAEGEEDSDQILQPRPAFVIAPGKKSLRPMTLDSNHRVPWRINTFMRDYQREGIRFLFERYKEGRGGLLGDDMGLGTLRTRARCTF
ncbi:hypothetical protein DAEQUDRAFT_767712 [Daedalea quercina L-15889]|uniref:Uncharacterized protein n=1 Tax=Daedalea quercina L-15889 TaxID=1314783 RepID=A0A165NAT6_9APHY|nr:hypothetical protein DAEQUDRAFT_767712 [Daedalea quercina L-15889]